jgi:signal transduction histidine kinase
MSRSSQPFPIRDLFLLATLCCLPAWAGAECFADLTGGDGRFAAAIAHDPHDAIAQLRALQASAGGAPTDPSPAHIDAMLMEAYFASGDIGRALDAATEGLSRLVPADGPGLQRRLQFRRLVLLHLSGQLRQATAAAEADAAAVPQDAPDLTCVLAERGYLRLRTDRVADAAADLMSAARLAQRVGSETYRLEANGILSMLYARDGFHDEALALADEAIGFYQDGRDPQRLADAYFRRGDVLLEHGSYTAAAPDFRKSLALSRDAGTVYDADAAQQRLCRALAHMANLAEAREFCTGAYTRARLLAGTDSPKVILSSLGEIELTDGHTAAANDYFNRALGADGNELSPRSQAEIRRLRGRARQQLGDLAGALQDMTEVVVWMDRERQTSNAERVSLLNLKTELEEKERELAHARAEEDVARREASRQALLRNLITVGALGVTASILIIGWLSWRRGQLDAARRAAESRLTAIGKLTAGIAHEFNNRLTVIQQAAGLLARRAAMAVDPPSMDLIAEIDRSTRASAEITGQLLSFARQQHLAPCALRLVPFLREILPTLQRIVGALVTVSTEASDSVPPVWVDPRQLTAALLNLSANSRDAMDGRGRLEIRVSRESARRVRIEVSDTGCGMTREVLARVTDPFFTTKAVGSGSGLGLSMVDGFVRQSGGEMQLRSEPGRGTTVSLLLPVAS